MLFASMFFGPSFAVAQAVAPVPMRAVSASVLLFIQTIIGMTAGPFLVGVISDLLAPSTGKLSLAYFALGPDSRNQADNYLLHYYGWLGPDLQIAFVHAPFDIIIGQANPNAVSMLPGLVRPLSRGYVALQSADPMVKPLINPNYLSMQSDLDRLVKTIEIGRDIFSAGAFKEWLTGK